MLSIPRILSRDLRPLTRIFDELESSALSHQNHPFFRHQNLNFNSFSPSFDVKETKDSYILDGELPGISDKSALDLSFVDANTLVIKGRIERNNESGRPEAAGKEGGENTHYHSPTVEEEGSSSTEVTKTSGNTEVGPAQESDKYWVRERYVGEFQRAFSFPQNVDHEAVKASLKDGILSVVVPKKKGPDGVRKITVE
ncbi:hypothetical protein ABW19_dt0208556 [Dactylella cylindrospora]|nr:hypothetical protein ABW19_dt0208556 [Dactylella cylindrospora]